MSPLKWREFFRLMASQWRLYRKLCMDLWSLDQTYMSTRLQYRRNEYTLSAHGTNLQRWLDRGPVGRLARFIARWGWM